MILEEWRPVTVEPYCDLYEVSNYGRVRRVVGGAGRARAGHILKPNTTNSGHKRATLSAPYKKFMVHRLVLEAFVGPCPEGMECCHNDCDPSNNRLDNLRWDTRSANQLDRHKTVGWVNHEGDKNGRSKLTMEAVRQLRKEVASMAHRKRSSVRARIVSNYAAKYGVHETAVRRAMSGEGWKEVV